MEPPTYLYAALLDVLGYRNLLEADRTVGALKFQQRLSEALSTLSEVSGAIKVQAISDTIILTCSGHNEFPAFLVQLRKVFVAFLNQGLYVRGGVAYSRHFQEGHVTYSHAIATAYELESKVAGYPRIVIDKNIIDMYRVGDSLPPLLACDLLCHENGVYFLDILTAQNWAEVYSCAKSIATSDALHGLQEAAVAKQLRFERYLLTSRHAPPGAKPFIAPINTV